MIIKIDRKIEKEGEGLGGGDLERGGGDRERERGMGGGDLERRAFFENYRFTRGRSTQGRE